ncbi:MAG: Biotin synthase [Firmicutes bacterium]|nr:Biotin synthase [Bacillota bacterium]
MESVDLIMNLGTKVLTGGRIGMDEAVALSAVGDRDLPFLAAMADGIRRQYVGEAVDLCSIVNGRSGLCSENCAFCAQSAHSNAALPVYPLLSQEELLAAARKAETDGALRFAIVTSGRGMERDGDFSRLVEALARIKEETQLAVCCSLGSLSPANAVALKEAGVSRYHHNVETSSSYYSAICTSHTYEDRVNTIRVVKEAGLEVCSGGIIGLGETINQRLEMAFELKALNVDSVPINVLNAIKGTPLENQPPLSPLDILKTFALFRFILPECGLRTAGGREVNLRDLQAIGLWSGINGMLIGGYLTTGGRSCATDLAMIHDLGRIPLSAREIGAR